MTDWSRIVEQHGPTVWNTVYRLLDNEADAADCFQNAFVEALKLSRREAVRNWPGLLKRLATASALAGLRRRYRQSSRVDSVVDGSTPDPKQLEPARAAETDELAEHLCRALAKLDARQAQVFCLACLEGLSYREIAAEMGVRLNHVGVLLNRARSRLREQLRAFDPASAGETSAEDHPP
jgi:RNA polymerase sigma-70 factor (ECF subfamily)